MADRARAAERLARAVREGERVVVFGDYDCDGITATAVLTEALRAFGAEVVPLLASRWGGGYGLSDAAVDRVLAARPGVLVTCDCGSSDAPRLRRIAEAGIDAVVIDHHLVPPEPLPAVAFLNPCRPECGFPFKGLASCGLALSVAAAVRAELRAAFDLRELLDLVAIGTVADVVPLGGDNRALVRAGLGVLARGSRPGALALLENAKVDRAAGLTAEDVAFRIAPRLNAPGRLGAPDPSLALLLERDPARARALAAEVEQLQTRRREVEAGVLEAALAQITRSGWEAAPSLVLAGQGWSPGVVGIVAGRLASRFGKPTVVVGLEGETGRGSARGPRGARLHDALRASAEALVGFGGHQAAAGVEVRADQVDAFRERFAAACAAQQAGGSAAAGDGAPRVDARLDPGDEPSRVLADLLRLEPCGEGNPAPRLAIPDARVVDAREVRGGHLKLTFELASGRRLSGFGADMGGRARALPAHVLLTGALRRDGWRGGDAVEVRLDAVEPA
jgi:single-stranded-DNA-specific exonuclease